MTQRDSLSEAFDTWKNNHDIDPIAADNIVLARPVFDEVFESEYWSIEWKSILEYWCGTWWFVKKLVNMGGKVIGIDRSPWMAAKAASNLEYIWTKQKENMLAILTWNHEDIARMEHRYDIITSIMTFQFVDRKELFSMISSLDKKLNQDWLFMFAVWNPKRIQDGIDNFDWFSGMESSEDELLCEIDFGKEKIVSYNRNSSIYDELLISFWYKKIKEEYPPFTKEFLKTYNRNQPKEHSEYLILAYKKI